MPAMTMVFQVTDATMLDRVKAGFSEADRESNARRTGETLALLAATAALKVSARKTAKKAARKTVKKAAKKA